MRHTYLKSPEGSTISLRIRQGLIKKDEDDFI